jgi:hypothetical protein
MSNVLLASFSGGAALVTATRAAKSRNYRILDAFTPFPVEGIDKYLELRPSLIRPAMLIGGFAMAAFAYGFQYYAAVIAYPYNSGGRPLDAWPTFMLVPFASGILLASICGFAAFLFETGLPRLHHPLFDADDFVRVTQDAFVLALVRPETKEGLQDIVMWLRELGAQLLDEIEL